MAVGPKVMYCSNAPWGRETVICYIVPRELNTMRPTLVFFLAPTKPLQSYGWASRTRDTVLVQSRDMTGRSQTLVARRRRVKATENIIHLPLCIVQKALVTRPFSAWILN